MTGSEAGAGEESTAPRGLFVGLTTLDVVHRIDTYPGANEKVTSTAISVTAGGPAANAAVTFAALGGTATLVSALGVSALARSIRAELISLGVAVVDTDPDAASLPPVSSVAVVENTGTRAVIGSDAISVGTPIPELTRAIRSANVILVDGHYPALAVEASRVGRQCAVPVIVDAGRWKPVMNDLISQNPEMLCSNDFSPQTHGDQTGTAQVLRQRGVSTVVITHGPDAIEWWTDNDTGRVSPPQIKAVDTLGAGDVFHGAYAYYRCLPDLGLAQRLSCASTIAALRCSHWGIRTWIGQLSNQLPHSEEETRSVKH